MAENQIHSNFYGSSCYSKIEEDPFKNEGAREVTTDLPLLVYADFL